MLIVQTDADSQTVTQHAQMPSGAAPDIDHPHPCHNDVVEEIDLRLQERADLGRLRGWVQSPIQ